MVSLHPVRFHIPFHIPVPAIHPIAHGIQCHAVQHPAVHRSIRRIFPRLQQVDTFRPFRQQVVAEPVVFFQVPIQFQLHQLLSAEFRLLVFFLYFRLFPLLIPAPCPCRRIKKDKFPQVTHQFSHKLQFKGRSPQQAEPQKAPVTASSTGSPSVYKDTIPARRSQVHKAAVCRPIRTSADMFHRETSCFHRKSQRIYPLHLP